MKDLKLDGNNVDLDVADVIMYALDNGKHDVFISCYENSTCVTIKPVKEKENGTESSS